MWRSEPTGIQALKGRRGSLMYDRVQKTVSVLTDSARGIVAIAIACGLFAAAIEYLAHTTLLSAHLSADIGALVDAATIGVLFSALVWVLLVGARARRRVVLRHLRVVAELNHNVRNALQLIVDSHYLPPPQQTEAILASVSRIDRTLRLLFPTVDQPAARRAAGSE